MFYYSFRAAPISGPVLHRASEITWHLRAALRNTLSICEKNTRLLRRLMSSELAMAAGSRLAQSPDCIPEGDTILRPSVFTLKSTA